jgi:hypothetical protein
MLNFLARSFGRNSWFDGNRIQFLEARRLKIRLPEFAEQFHARLPDIAPLNL